MIGVCGFIGTSVTFRDSREGEIGDVGKGKRWDRDSRKNGVIVADP
jgi:hypothetical protein